MEAREIKKEMKHIVKLENFSDSWTGCVKFLNAELVAIHRGNKNGDSLVIYNYITKSEKCSINFPVSKHSYSLWTIDQYS